MGSGVAPAITWQQNNSTVGSGNTLNILPGTGITTSGSFVAGVANITINATGGGGGGGIVTYSGAAVVLSGGTTVYVPFGGDTLGSGTEASVQMKVQPSAAISNACVTLSTAPGSGNSLAVTLRDGSANTAITMTVSNAATSACDTTHTVTNAAGDLLDWALTPSGTIALFTPNVGISAQFGSPGGTVYYQTIQVAGSARTQEPVLNFVSGVTCVDVAGVSTNCTASGGGGGSAFFSGSLTAITPGDWSAIGTGGSVSTVTGAGGGNALKITGLPGTGTDGNWAGQQVSVAGTTWTKTVIIYGPTTYSTSGVAATTSIGFTDGTKFEGVAVAYLNSGTSANGAISLTNVTGGSIAGVSGALAFGTNFTGPIFIQLVKSNSGNTLSGFVSADGANWDQVFTESGPFLTASGVAAISSSRGGSFGPTFYLESFQ